MRFPLSLLLLAGACGSSQAAPVLTPESARGPVAGPAGRVLVLSASCGSLEAECRSSWAPAVDAIVQSGLEFHGYRTIDPGTLRKDEPTRTETSTAADERASSSTQNQSTQGGLVLVFPVISSSSTKSSSVSLLETRSKTVVLEGARFEDLRLEDRNALMLLAGADSVLTTRVVVGANYSVWTSAQSVEVVIKLADAKSGEMRWSARCSASSRDFPNVDAALEQAARCAVSAFTAAG